MRARQVNRVGIKCPRCAEVLDLPLTIRPTLTYSHGNGEKAFLTAEVGIGGTEHTCAT